MNLVLPPNKLVLLRRGVCGPRCVGTSQDPERPRAEAWGDRPALAEPVARSRPEG